MEASQKKVIDNLNATLSCMQEARDTIDPNVYGYQRIIAQHDNIVKQLTDLRDLYARPRDGYTLTPDEIATHNIHMAQRMIDGGMSPESVSAAFKQDGIDMPADFIREITKPGVMDALSGKKKD